MSTLKTYGINAADAPTPEAGYFRWFLDTTNSSTSPVPAVKTPGGSVIQFGGLSQEQVEDIMGASLTDTGTIDFSYDDPTGKITAAIKANSVDNTYVADMATQTLKGRSTAGTGDPEDLTTTQVTAMLNVATTALKGLLSANDKTKLDGIASGATANTIADNAPPNIGAASATGASSNLARQDHTHGFDDTAHGSRGGGSLHAVAVSGGANGFMLGADKQKLDTLPSTAPPTSRNITAGAGLTGGGNLTSDRTLDVVAGDSTIVVNADELHANVGTGAGSVAAGNDSRIVNATPNTRSLVAGAGLIGGGDLTADRTINVGANADGSIVVNADDIRVGVVSDTQHGQRSGGNLHPAATQLSAGFLSAVDKFILDNRGLGWFNVRDYAPAGTLADGNVDWTAYITAAISAMTSAGGTLFFPPGIYLISGTITINKGGVRFMGANKNNCIIRTNQTTGDMILANEWFFEVDTLSFGTSVNRTAGAIINNPTTMAYMRVRNVRAEGSAALRFWDGILLGGTLSSVDDLELRFWSNDGVRVTGTSDRVINRLVTDNPANNTARAGIRVEQCGSLLISNCNVIHAGDALQLAPQPGMTIPSVYGVNTFFDNSVNGMSINNTGGSVFRCKFTQCWFASHTNAGVLLNLATMDGIDFLNCDMYGSQYGIQALAAYNWSVGSSRIAGNSVAGIDVTATAGAEFRIYNNFIGSTAAFGPNAIGVRVNAGATYLSYSIRGNDFSGNTTAFVDNGTATAGKLVADNVPGPMGNGAWTSQTTDSAALTANTSEQVAYTVTVPANALQVGTMLRMTVAGTATHTAAAVNTTARVRVGAVGSALTGNIAATTIQATNAVAQTNAQFTIDALLTIRAVGAAGTIIGALDLGGATYAGGGGVATSTSNTATVVIDTTQSRDFVLSLTQSAATLTAVTIRQATLEVVKP